MTQESVPIVSEIRYSLGSERGYPLAEFGRTFKEVGHMIGGKLRSVAMKQKITLEPGVVPT